MWECYGAGVKIRICFFALLEGNSVMIFRPFRTKIRKPQHRRLEMCSIIIGESFFSSSWTKVLNGMRSSPTSLSCSSVYTKESASAHLRALAQSVSVLNKTLNSSFNPVHAFFDDLLLYYLEQHFCKHHKLMYAVPNICQNRGLQFIKMSTEWCGLTSGTPSPPEWLKICPKPSWWPCSFPSMVLYLYLIMV